MYQSKGGHFMTSRHFDLSVLAIAVFLMAQSTLAAYGVRVVRGFFEVTRSELVLVAHQSNDSADMK
jgi:hypothetical protein